MLLRGQVGNNTSSGNSATGHGGGVWGAGGRVAGVRIVANNTLGASSSGGGVCIHANAHGTVLQNCLIAGNTSQYFCAGGIYTTSNFDGMLSACMIVDNEVRSATADRRGAGVYASGSNNIFNCVIASNRWVTPPTDAADIDLAFGGDQSAASNSVHYCLTPRELPLSQGNINGAALFRDDAWHLAGGSPGINAGTNEAWMLEPGAMDLDGRPRLDYFTRRVDMGCYEYLPPGMLFQVR